MSEAKRCDRCGIFFESHLGGCMIRKKLSSIRCIDLCAKCYDELNEWLEKKNENEQSGDTQIKD